MKDTYTQAILELLNSGEKTSKVLDGVKRVMETRGHEALYKVVLQNVLRILESKPSKTLVFVFSEDDLKKHKTAIESALKKLKAEEKPEIVVDESLVGGFVAEHNHQRIDNSYKTALMTLYRNITTASN